MKTITLYRPVGLKELELIMDSGWKAFPPRLFWQPVFYPVLNQAYAEEIASKWNTEDEASGYCGIVTAFEVDEAYYSTFTVQQVGSSIHEELWVPAEELDTFNTHINGLIQIRSIFFGNQFIIPENETLARELLKFKQDAI